MDPAITYFAIFVVILVVFLLIVGFIRSRIESQGLRDFIGISMAFLVLLAATAAFIVGEHAVG